MKISVVIPCLNAASTLGAQLEALASQEYDGPWELVFADNGSTDGSVALAESFRPRLPALRIVDASARKGPSYAKNQGVAAASGGWLAFVDADDVAGEGYLAGVAKALAAHPVVACRSDGKRLNPPGLDWTAQEWGLQRLWYPPWALHAAGGTIAVRRELFEDVGGYDNELLYLEDTDFCLKMHARAETLQFAGEALVHYRNRKSFGDLVRQSKRWSENHIILARRYGRPSDDTRVYWTSFAQDWLRVAELASRSRDRQVRRELAWWLGRQVGRTTGLLKYFGPPV